MQEPSKQPEKIEELSWWQKFVGWFRKEPTVEKPPKPEEQGGGMVLSLDRVLQRLDDSNNLPTAVRANAIRTLANMAGKEVHMAASLGDLKRAKRVHEALQSVETKFPKAIDSLTQEDRSNLVSQKDRTASRVARLENRLTTIDGNASKYGAVPNAATQQRKNKLKG